MCKKRRFPELQGYMYVSTKGDYEFTKDCPENLKEMIRKEWPAYKKEVIKEHKKGNRDSRDWF